MNIIRRSFIGVVTLPKYMLFSIMCLIYLLAMLFVRIENYSAPFHILATSILMQGFKSNFAWFLPSLVLFTHCNSIYPQRDFYRQKLGSYAKESYSVVLQMFMCLCICYLNYLGTIIITYCITANLHLSNVLLYDTSQLIYSVNGWINQMFLTFLWGGFYTLLFAFISQLIQRVVFSVIFTVVCIFVDETIHLVLTTPPYWLLPSEHAYLQKSNGNYADLINNYSYWILAYFVIILLFLSVVRFIKGCAINESNIH